AYDFENKRFGFGKVTKLMHHAPEEMTSIYYFIINNQMRVTPEHPFLTDKGLVVARDLVIGSNLIDESGKFIPVISIDKVYERVPTYNFEVEDYHTYFADGFAVHNKEPVDEGTGRVIAVDNLITGNYVANLTGCTSYAKQTCDEIYTIHADICGCGNLNPPCNEITDLSSCNAMPDCEWCVDAPGDYEYTVPKRTGQTSWPFCVNITNDPFNCGKCGFESGIHTTGVCAGNTPYCAGKTCQAPGALDDTEKKEVEAYTVLHSSVNPSYYPYSPSTDVYAPDQVDTLEIACTAGGGTLSDLGCCGDGKCRVSEGDICHARRVCDGTQWHDESLTDQNGEVFLSPDCKSIYPIANINGDFIKCVDKDQFEDYLKSMVRAAGACVPDEYSSYINPEHFPGWHTEGNSIPWDWEGQYSCPAGTYWTGEEATSTGSTGADQCRIKDTNPDVPSSGYLVCTAWSGANNQGLFGFATMGDANNNNIDGWFKTPYSIAFCPAPISTWEGVTIIPEGALACPGKMAVSNIDSDMSTVMVYGSNDNERFAVFCSDNSGLKIDSTLDFMGYVKGNGSSMGNVSGHEYVCHTDYSKTFNPNVSRAVVAICCGNASSAKCKNDIPGTIGQGGVMYSVGARINASGKFLYCMADGTWGSDLDYNTTQDACSQSGFLATGKYCCSEGDDIATCVKESYNDLGSAKGACFKGEAQYNNFNLVYNSQTYTNVFLSNGSFWGCGFNDSLFKPEFERDKMNTSCNVSLCKPGTNGRVSQDCLQSVENWPNPGAGANNTRTNRSLIKAADYCSIFSSGSKSVYCAFNNNWTDAGGNNLSHKSEVPDPLFSYLNKTVADAGGDTSKLMKANCCLPNHCWDPAKGTCIAEQLSYTEYYQVNDTAIYKCLQGAWVNILGTGQKTPDGCVIGFCPEKTQCLYNIAGNPNYNGNLSPGANPQCLNHGQYKEDFVCVNGSWTTRTKMLAMKMASLVDVDEDFVLMCAPPDTVLINVQNPGSTNNYCVLNWKDNGASERQRIIGTTLNQPFIAPNHTDFITALEQSFLLSYADSGVQFSSSCTSTPTTLTKCVDNQYLKAYYDPTYQMVFLSSQNIQNLGPGIGDSICLSLPSWLKWLCPQPGVLEINLRDLQLFSKVYASRLGVAPTSDEVFGVAEQVCDPVLQFKKWFYTFNYTGLSNADLSYLVSHIDAENASITISGNNVVIKNPKKDAWVPLTILRNTEQE
ncbi:MAG TPA: Hint domain-containing protein, partial [Candidatus Nanoarchaeia archaeon]|nr:Hint domain-containing protein [Candidatus Nanoarchaeia archaeon]